MKKLYAIVLIFCFLLVNAQAYQPDYSLLIKRLGMLDTLKKSAKSSTKFTDTRREKPEYLKNEVSVKITPFKPTANTKTTDSNLNTLSPAPVANKNTAQDLKTLSNVRIYPNPVAEQLTLSYFVNKDSNVTIKIMDVLGNEIATLLSQRMPAGEQTNSFSISSKLNSGYYFIRLIVGNETVIKRVSIL